MRPCDGGDGRWPKPNRRNADADGMRGIAEQTWTRQCLRRGGQQDQTTRSHDDDGCQNQSGEQRRRRAREAISFLGLNKANRNQGEGEENIKEEESTHRPAAQSATLFQPCLSLVRHESEGDDYQRGDDDYAPTRSSLLGCTWTRTESHTT